MGLHTPRFPLLQELGLSQNEALLYELLLEKGLSKPADLVEPSGLGRGNVYNVLQQLLEKGLVQLKELGKFQLYEAIDPTGLRELLNRKREETARLEQTFQATLPQLTSLFRLSTGKPAIQVFEGLSGMEAVLHDSLEAKDEILTYFDPDAMTAAFADMNQRYVKTRVAAGVKKRILLPDTPTGQQYATRMQNAQTLIRLVPHLPTDFKTAVEIYNQKVSFHVLTPDKPIAFILENEYVAAFHRATFTALWKLAREA